MSWNFGYTDHDWAWKRQSLLDDNDYNNKGYDPDSSYGAMLLPLITKSCYVLTYGTTAIKSCSS